MLKAICKLGSPLLESFYTQSLIPKKIVNTRLLHLTYPQCKNTPEELRRRGHKRDQGADGESVVDVDQVLMKQDLFPDMDTPNRIFNGVQFKNLPILNIKCSKNNTILSISDYKGGVTDIWSCGCEGFKGAKRATNIAAQATAIAFSKRSMDAGYKTVRVRVRGLGPGRMSAMKGLQMGGMEIVSITDFTPVSWNPPRPKKQRRV